MKESNPQYEGEWCDICGCGTQGKQMQTKVGIFDICNRHPEAKKAEWIRNGCVTYWRRQKLCKERAQAAGHKEYERHRCDRARPNHLNCPGCPFVNGWMY